MNSRILLLACAVLISLGILGYRELLLQPDGDLHAYFLDVDQGDAILLVTPSGKQILVDGGPNMETLEHLGHYMPFLDRTIELLVLSHPHADHLTAFPEILRRYNVEQVLLSGYDYAASQYKALIEELLSRKIEVILADSSRDISMGDGVLIDVVWPHPEDLNELDTNNASVVVRILYGTHKILLPGDIETEAEMAILRSEENIQSDVIKVPHHGSISSSSTGFLLAVRPELGIISAGRENSFGHPHEAIIQRYEKMSIPLRITAKEGTISLTFTR